MYLGRLAIQPGVAHQTKLIKKQLNIQLHKFGAP